MSLVRNLNSFVDRNFVLVLEPAPNYRTSIKIFLTNLKVKNVRFVSTVAEAKREMLSIKVALFIVEWQLPEKNGLQFCRELRKDKTYKNTPYLLLSAENLRKDVMLATEGGIDSYLLKPFSYQDFCAQISALLDAARNPSPLNSLIERAEWHIDQKEYWVAEELLKEALAIKPASAKALCALGRIEFRNKNIPMALTHLQSAITFNPDYVDAYKFILQIAEERTDMLGVLQVASILHSISPENPRYPLLIAFAHMEMGHLADSEHYFKLSVRLSPTLADGYKGLGSVYLKQKDFENARKALEKALDLDKGDVSTLNSLGLAYVRQDLVDEGIRKYRMALSIDAVDFRVLFNLGLALEMKGDLKGAKESFQRAGTSNPNFEKAKRNIERIKKIAPSTEAPASLAANEEGEFSVSLIKKGA